MQLVQSRHLRRNFAKIAENSVRYAQKVMHWYVLTCEGVSEGLRLKREWESRGHRPSQW